MLSRYLHTSIPRFNIVSKVISTPINQFTVKLYNEAVNSGKIELKDAVSEALLQDSQLSKEVAGMLHNKMIENFTKEDFSIATLHGRALSKLDHPLSLQSFIEILQYNPGRVKTSWELFMENKPIYDACGAESQLQLAKIVLDKLASDEGSLVLARRVFLSSMLPGQSNQDLAQKLIESGCYSGLSYLSEYVSLSSEMSDEQLLGVWQYANTDLSGIEEYDIVRLISLASKETPHEDQLAGEISKLNELFGADIKPRSRRTFQDLVSAAEVAPTGRVVEALIKAQGITLNNLPQALKVYHQFLSKFNPESVLGMYKVAVYHAFQDSKLLPMAQSLCPVQQTVRSLNLEMMLDIKYNPEHPLKTYNEVIQKLSKENNEYGYSPAGSLTESLVLATLYTKDRDFANVILDGAIKHGILQGATAVKRVKSIMSQYGDALDGNFEKDFDQVVLDRIAKL